MQAGIHKETTNTTHTSGANDANSHHPEPNPTTRRQPVQLNFFQLRLGSWYASARQVIPYRRLLLTHRLTAMTAWRTGTQLKTQSAVRCGGARSSGSLR